MFIAHEGIADSRNILLHADKREQFSGVRQENFWQEPGQRAIFCNEAVKGMLQEIHENSSPKMVRESLLDCLNCAEKMTGENFYHYRDPVNVNSSLCFLMKKANFINKWVYV